MSEQAPSAGETRNFDSRTEAAEQALALIRGARQEICFFGPSIDPVLFDSDEVAEAISSLARRSPRTRVRFVVFDTRSNISHRHRLLPLAQRLSSKIEVRIASLPHQETRQMYLLVDTDAYLYCPDNSRYQGESNAHAPLKVRELQNQFEEAWTHATPDSNTRRLNL